MGLSENELDALEQIVETLGPFHRGDHLFRQGDPSRALYVVRSGYIKASSVSSTGDEHVLGFYMFGELLGLESITSDRKRCSAVILDTSMVCRLPFDDLSSICTYIPTLQKQLFRLISQGLMTAEEHSLHRSADGRLATFLLDWGERLARNGFSAHQFTLPMSRQDIGSYLQIAPETVSRCFTRFEGEKWIESTGHALNLTDITALTALRKS